MELKDWVTIIVAISAVVVAWIAPLRAISIGHELANNKEITAAKHTLFKTLFALRGSPNHPEFVLALNQIPLTFQDDPVVLNAWKDYYNALDIKGRTEDAEDKRIWNTHRVAVLLNMAKILGYRIPEFEIMKDAYIPTGHQFQWDFDWQMQARRFEYYKIATEMCHESIAFYRQHNGQSGQEQSEPEA